MSAQLESMRLFVADRPPAAKPTGTDHVVVLGSGKGGVGTSTLASLLAAVTSSTGARVLLVDGTADVGTQHLLLGTAPGAGWLALRGGESTPDDALVTVTDSLTLLPGTAIEEYAAGMISAAERQALFRRVASLYPRYDLVIVDGGSKLESVLAACAAGVGSVLAVTTPDRVSVAATYGLVKILEGRHPGISIRALMNRNQDGAAQEASEILRAGARRFLDRTIGHAGTVPEDQCLRAGLEAGMNVQDAAVGSDAAGVIYQVGKELVRNVTAGSVSAGDPLNLHRRL